MLLRLAILFIVLPLFELALLLEISHQTSPLFTLGLVIFTGILGAWLARREGWNCLRRVQNDLAAGRMPADSLVDGLMILVAGALLLTPGIVTDLVGFSFLIPPLRGFIKRRLKARFGSRFVVAGFQGTGPRATRNDDIIDVESRPSERPEGRVDRGL